MFQPFFFCDDREDDLESNQVRFEINGKIPFICFLCREAMLWTRRKIAETKTTEGLQRAKRRETEIEGELFLGEC